MKFLGQIARQIFRLATFLFLLLTYALGATILQAFIRGPFQLRKHLATWVQLHTRVLLRAFGIYIETENRPASESMLIVSNHLGYLDALVISSLMPVSFVTSVEMRDAFFIGWLTKLAGCLYVERRNKENIQNEISMLTEALRAGVNVCVFPEATSTNGDSVLRFRRPLYTAAVTSGRPVQPVCLNYETIGGQLVTRANRDFLFWYGDMPFFSHLWSLWSIRSARVRVTFSSELIAQQPDPVAHLADSSHAVVSSLFRPISG